MSLQAIFLTPERDVGEQLAEPTAGRLIAAGARLYTRNHVAALSLVPLAGWSRGAVKIASRDRAVIHITESAA